jgi:uncharacterized membrane protein SirB2
MLEFYPQIRMVHVVTAIASGTLFFLRGLLVSAGRGEWALAAIPRYASYAIDTTLLLAAVLLVAILPSSVFTSGWLAVKLGLLPIYVVLGWFALRRPPAGGRQAAWFAAAVLVYLGMFAVARTHDPLGPFRALAGP